MSKLMNQTTAEPAPALLRFRFRGSTHSYDSFSQLSIAMGDDIFEMETGACDNPADVAAALRLLADAIERQDAGGITVGTATAAKIYDAIEAGQKQKQEEEEEEEEAEAASLTPEQKRIKVAEIEAAHRKLEELSGGRITYRAGTWWEAKLEPGEMTIVEQ